MVSCIVQQMHTSHLCMRSKFDADCCMVVDFTEGVKRLNFEEACLSHSTDTVALCSPACAVTSTCVGPVRQLEYRLPSCDSSHGMRKMLCTWHCLCEVKPCQVGTLLSHVVHTN